MGWHEANGTKQGSNPGRIALYGTCSFIWATEAPDCHCFYKTQQIVQIIMSCSSKVHNHFHMMIDLSTPVTFIQLHFRALLCWSSEVAYKESLCKHKRHLIQVLHILLASSSVFYRFKGGWRMTTTLSSSFLSADRMGALLSLVPHIKEWYSGAQGRW